MSILIKKRRSVGEWLEFEGLLLQGGRDAIWGDSNMAEGLAKLRLSENPI